MHRRHPSPPRPRATLLSRAQDQTPQHPKGDGSCTEACDCGGVPCGEYLWDHRAPGLREYLINEFLLNPVTGLGNPNITGFCALGRRASV
jgi:hypothetical protein